MWQINRISLENIASDSGSIFSSLPIVVLAVYWTGFLGAKHFYKLGKKSTKGSKLDIKDTFVFLLTVLLSIAYAILETSSLLSSLTCVGIVVDLSLWVGFFLLGQKRGEQPEKD